MAGARRDASGEGAIPPMKKMRRAVLRTLSASLIVCSAAAPALADRVERVKDINNFFTPDTTSSPVFYFDAGNGVAFFQAYQPATGRELWRTDGTEAGTYLVKDINPGPADSLPQA